MSKILAEGVAAGAWRRDWRKVLAIGLLFLTGVGGGAARQDGKTAGPGTAPESVRLTIELNWAISGDKAASDGGQGPSPGLGLELSEGRVVEAMPWPPSDSGSPPGWGPAEREGWRLGVATEGRVRARIEAPVDAKLIVRGGDQVVSVPLAAVLERPQRTPSPAPLTVAVERLAWDTLSVELGASASGGIAAPGAEVPVSVGFNILWPEPTDVTVRYSAVLRPARGGEVISRRDGQEVLPTNRLAAPVHILGLRAPVAEGAYTIEVQASWEPVVREGSRLGRLIRRRKPAVAATSSVRRVALTVLGPAAPPAAEGGAAARDGRRGEVEVDSVDLVRPRIHRFLTAGRSPIAEDGRSAWDVPAPALIEPSRRERLRGGFLRPGPEADRLDPADGSGLSWSAVGLKAAHPERPHRLTLTIQGGEPSALGVGLIEARDARPTALGRGSCWTPAPPGRRSSRMARRSPSRGWSGPARPRPCWSRSIAARTRPCDWGPSRSPSSRTCRGRRRSTSRRPRRPGPWACTSTAPTPSTPSAATPRPATPGPPRRTWPGISPTAARQPWWRPSPWPIGPIAGPSTARPRRTRPDPTGSMSSAGCSNDRAARSGWSCPSTGTASCRACRPPTRTRP